MNQVSTLILPPDLDSFHWLSLKTPNLSYPINSHEPSPFSSASSRSLPVVITNDSREPKISSKLGNFGYGIHFPAIICYNTIGVCSIFKCWNSARVHCNFLNRARLLFLNRSHEIACFRFISQTFQVLVCTQLKLSIYVSMMLISRYPDPPRYHKSTLTYISRKFSYFG